LAEEVLPRLSRRDPPAAKASVESGPSLVRSVPGSNVPVVRARRGVSMRWNRVRPPTWRI